MTTWNWRNIEADGLFDEMVALLRWHVTGLGQPDLDGSRGRNILLRLGENSNEVTP